VSTTFPVARRSFKLFKASAASPRGRRCETCGLNRP
jgi:hypothetical protein